MYQLLFSKKLSWFLALPDPVCFLIVHLTQFNREQHVLCLWALSSVTLVGLLALVLALSVSGSVLGVDIVAADDRPKLVSRLVCPFSTRGFFLGGIL